MGSVTSITDSNNNIVQSYTYDSFGNIANQTGSLIQPYAYTGREYDPETGLYYYRARYYDPKIGRFLQEDPVWDVNLYGYAGNNPVNYVDPYGLLTIPFTNIWIPAGEGAGRYATDYYARKWSETGNILYAIPGAIAALWTCETSDWTTTVLSTGWGLGKWAGRPYWQYYPKGNPGYSSPYFTRGPGWKAPYNVGREAAENLSLPPHNPGNAVRPFTPNPFKYMSGPSKVPPSFGHPGGGIEYILK